MKFYHATTPEIMDEIIEEGRIRRSWDGVVYLCKTAEDAAKFVAIRGAKTIQTIEVDLNESEVEESHDHAESFFRCKAYIYGKDIEVTGDEDIEEYEVK